MTEQRAAQEWYPGATQAVETRERPDKGTLTPNFWPGNNGRRAVVIHIAQGGFDSSINHMRDNGTSSHFIVSLSGRLKQLVSVNDSAWANGLSFDGHRWICPHKHVVTPRWELIDPHHNPNTQTISIEHEGFSGNTPSAAQLAATVDLLRWLARQFPSLAPYRNGSALIGHCDLDPVDKAFCPGKGFDLTDLARRANEGLDLVEPWLRNWTLRGVALPVEQQLWAIPQLYKKNFAQMGACLQPEDYPVEGLSIAVFERGLIYYLTKTNRAYLVRFAVEI